VPTIRDARGVLTEYRVEPIGSPPGPVERDRVSAARMADFAAERAAAAARPARAVPAVPPRPSPPAKRALNPTRTETRLARVGRYLDAIRASNSHKEAAEALGVGKHSIEMFVSDLRRRGELPDDVEAQLRARNPATRGGRAKHQAAKANGHAEPITQEASAPATAAATAELPDREPAAEVATPPGSPEPVIAAEYSAPDPTSHPSAHLVITVDLVALAAAMSSWQTYQISSFFDGLTALARQFHR
jgi:hypothetical protein